MSQRIIAMWSGPRNISTAMMRSWASRSDTRVVDEPFYAYYLQHTGYDHPGADEIIGSGETDWRKVIDNLLNKGNDKPIFFQKHMTQHMLDDVDRTWLRKVSNCFLIRDPRRMLLSFAKVIPNPGLDQTGLPQQGGVIRICARSHRDGSASYRGAGGLVKSGEDIAPNVRRARSVIRPGDAAVAGGQTGE